ncbi:hypothetical protein JCM11251_005498 [Rhodosporidiobolus azoricus]
MSSLLHHKSVRVAKPTHGHQPSKATGSVRTDHELVDRLQQWKHITKSLLYYHKGLADIEHASAKATHALTETIQVPFHEGHVFSPDGWQQTFYDVRDDTKLLAERHASFAETIENGIVRQIESVRSDIKQHIAMVEKEASVLANDVEKERETSKRDLLDLQSGIDTFENSSTQMLPQKDPYLSHHIVQNQLKKQVHKENDLQLALIRFQQQQPAFEENVARKLQSAIKSYEDARVGQVEEVESLHKRIASHLQRVEPDAEWQFFASRPENSLIDPNTPLRSIEAISFPGLDHASTKPLKEGYLERKKRFSKKYVENWYALTPSGYLHVRNSSNPADTHAPNFSLFLPECSLSAPSKESAKSHKFHVEGNKAVKSSFESKMKNTLRFGGKEIAYTFRARTHAEMMGWWEALDQLSRDTKTGTGTTTKIERDPVGVAVANLGYAKPNDSTLETAEHLAAVPGTREVEVEEGAEGESTAHRETSASSIRTTETTGTSTTTQPRAESVAEPALSSRSVKSVAVAAPSDGAVDGLQGHDHIETDSEEGGGSSEEEFDSGDEMAQARTAPSTPATGLGKNPMDEHLVAATLPAYSGSGTGQPEKAALLSEAKSSGNGPVLGSNGGPTLGKAINPNESVEVLGDANAPATVAATTSAS